MDDNLEYDGFEEVKEEKKKIKTSTLIIILLIGFIAVLYIASLQGNEEEINLPDIEVAKCIADKLILYTTQTCPHCNEQKEILGEYKNLFNNVDCTINYETCISNNITSVPTWTNGKERVGGVKQWADLKSFAGC